ncbi:MAG: glutamate synthase large subunit [Candidatus Hydrogenedentota bacterium]|nr:MAG: glutamate synthase large subunit [Candidatus Hydrogenedentota bacterium]
MSLHKLNKAMLREKVGMYDPANEHDACGVGFVAHVKGEKSRKIIDMALKAQLNLDHRGAVGADPKTGDGAGILMQMPDAFIRRVAKEVDIELPEYGRYAVAMVFFPQDLKKRKAAKNIFEKVVVDEGQEFLGWRSVPVDTEVPGEGARLTMPKVKMAFVAASEEIKDQLSFERKLFVIRRIIDHRIREELKLSRLEYYVPSFSSRVIVYKGMLLAGQLRKFYHDLNAEDMESALAIIHTRFSTNTFPSWDLAHPYRYIAHNGEINTLRGNINWMRTREIVMESPYFGEDLKRMLPIVMEGQSDSATFDTVFELLALSGRSLPHVMMMMIPEAWSKNPWMDPELKGFYEYHATMMEPWDGPAAVAFTDGSVIGATLDRNGLRPARYVVTKDDIVVMGSEAGLIEFPTEKIVKQGKLEPGKIFVIDLNEKRILDDEEVKKNIVKQKPYREWVEKNMIRLRQLPEVDAKPPKENASLKERSHIFGYSREDKQMILKPMVVHAQEPVGSMGVDVSLAVLSEKPQLLYRYFKQNFAQVTNPPVDAIREELVFELTTYIGPEGNLLDETPSHARRVELNHPVITDQELLKLKNLKDDHFKPHEISLLFNPAEKHGMRHRLEAVLEEAEQAVRNGATMLILSDRGVGKDHAPIPALLAVGGVHHHLIRKGLRTKTGLILESGEPREVPHFALLVGYGANAINPYMAFEIIHDLYEKGYMPEIESEDKLIENYLKAIKKGLFKIFSKMGISTLQSYCGAQIFEAVGIDSEVIDKFFAGTYSRVDGMSLEMIEKETLMRHQRAFTEIKDPDILDPGGILHYRKYRDAHLWNPITVAKLQQSTRENSYKTYKEFAEYINNQKKRHVTLRSLFTLDYLEKPIPIEEVEPASEIVKRFSTGAMSYGSISWETHTSLAIAMNRIGGKSNTGEGGEDPERFKPLPNGDSMNSAIKQVASGRFGVTANYLVHAEELQIKMAQGAKPGEGGQLPGFKVDKIIAKTRHSTPGVSLISPPPHHDIYSIEDLKQLIFDLKNINPQARISVKLVSEVGVGTVAAGVAKAHADHILISGHDGGTGASPISSIHYAGTPWELGLSETQQTLVLNGLRDRVWVATDGKLSTGLDVAYAALLGADEFGFSTAPLITLGCIMMRKCHLNTCPVGVATQDPVLRKKFMGSPEYVVNYMFFVAEELREIMAKLGYRTVNEMIGQMDRIVPVKPKYHWKARGIDFSNVLYKAEPAFGTKLYRDRDQDHGLEVQRDHELIKQAKPALDKKEHVEIEMTVRNVDRTIGAMLSGEVAKRYGDEGLPDDTIVIHAKGTAGQSFGCFLAKGITLRLEGVANDYCGKGLSGGKLIVTTPPEAQYPPTENIIIGNTCFYGATSGEAYINGLAGERFLVRNSGVHAVIEGVGEHGCEYMTGGRAVVLGKIGRNFAAGMSGGIAYIWDPDGIAEEYINQEMVELEKLTDTKDVDAVKELIENHYRYTGSTRASYILNNWETEAEKFIRVMPGEYKLALMKLEEEAAELEAEEAEEALEAAAKEVASHG